MQKEKTQKEKYKTNSQTSRTLKDMRGLQSNKSLESIEEKMFLDTDNDGKADILEEMDMEEDEKKNSKKPPKRRRSDTTYNPVTLAKDYFFGTDEIERD